MENVKTLYSGRKKIWVLDAEIPALTNDFVLSKTLDGKNFFTCQELGGSFETLKNIGGVIVDNGVNYISIKLTDAGTDYQFTDNFLPADLLLSPGRVKSDKATNNLTTANPTSPLYKMIPFIHKFTDKLEVRASNSSNTSIKLRVIFVGLETRIDRV